MKLRVQQKLDQIFRYPFFESVGEPLPSAISSVKNWTQASKSCGFLKWKNNKLMARNALKNAIEKQYPKAGMWERMQEWNPLVDELRPPIIEPFVETLLQKTPIKGKQLENIRYALRSDLMLICLETHYQDIVKPRFFIPYLDPWYASGHFPCGWDGDQFAHDFETGDETIFFDGWDNLSRHGKLIVF